VHLWLPLANLYFVPLFQYATARLQSPESIAVNYLTNFTTPHCFIAKQISNPNFTALISLCQLSLK